VNGSSLSGQRGEQLYGTVTFGMKLRQIDACIRDSAFCLPQLNPRIESDLEPPLCDGQYL
jgi:hypothetical protein